MADAPVPRKAATVLVVRSGDDGLEVFMIKRPGRGVFPNLHVFPGGKVDGDDDGLGHLCHGLDEQAARATLGLADGGLRYWVTAIRECFEECGVLLAYRNGELFEPTDEAEAERFDGYRSALIDGALDMPTLARRERLQLATDRVRYFSHWITPESAPARFDTRFFAAAMPPGQRARGHAVETADGTWVTPREALANHAADRWQMIHPTLTTLRTALQYASAGELMDAVATGHHIGNVPDDLRAQGMQRRPA